MKSRLTLLDTVGNTVRLGFFNYIAANKMQQLNIVATGTKTPVIIIQWLFCLCLLCKIAIYRYEGIFKSVQSATRYSKFPTRGQQLRLSLCRTWDVSMTAQGQCSAPKRMFCWAFIIIDNEKFTHIPSHEMMCHFGDQSLPLISLIPYSQVTQALTKVNMTR